MRMSDNDTVVIIGAGLMGAAAAWALASRGRPVVVLEQFAAGHLLGGSHGSARIVRRAYGDELYTRLTGRAFELWRSLEDLTGVPLLRMTGALDFGPGRDVPTIATHLAAAGVPHEVLPPSEAERRWAGMRFDTDVLFHEQAGTLDADAAVGTMLAEAARLGAVIRHQTGAAAVRRVAGGVQVSCPDGSAVSGGVVVVAAGGWVGPLLDGVVDVPPMRVTEQHVFHFPRLDPSAPPWPSVIHERDWAAYHLAGGRDGGPGDDRKVGAHDGLATEAGRLGEITPATRQRIVDYVRDWLPGLDPTPSSEATCLYTRTPSENFIVDREGPVVVCSPCSGHGAKFAPLIGEYVADLVTGAGEVPERFRLQTHRRGLSGSVSL